MSPTSVRLLRCCRLAALLPALSACQADDGVSSVAAPMPHEEQARPEPVSTLLGGASARPVELAGERYRVRSASEDLPARAQIELWADPEGGGIAVGSGGMTLPVGISRLGARRPRAVAVEAGALSMREVARDVDALLFARPRAVEDLLVVWRASADLGYVFDLPDEWALEQDAASVVEVRDPLGARRLRITASRAWDAEGAPVPVQLHLGASSSVVVRIEPAVDARYPIYVDPELSLGTAPSFDRSRHTLTSTPDGRVLLIGGPEPLGPFDSSCPAEAIPVEVFDVRTMRFDVVSDELASRCDHTATLLTNGEVLVAGGWVTADGQEQVLGLVERVSAQDGSLVASAELASPRRYHTATRLRDGRVLIAGGEQLDDDGSIVALDSAELWDPSEQRLVSIPSMLEPRTQHTATLLPDGRVLVAGGSRGPERLADAVRTAELFDPSSSSWAPTPSPMLTKRTRHAASLRHDGTVALAGGWSATSATTIREVFDPETGTFAQWGSPVASSFEQDRNMFFALPAPEPSVDNMVYGGTALYASGARGVLLPFSRVFTMELAGSAAVAEMQDAEDAFEATEGPIEPRGGHTATVMGSGRILLAGGRWYHPDLVPPEQPQLRVQELDPITRQVIDVGAMTRLRHDHTATLLEDGRVLVVGGDSPVGADNRVSELYDPQARAFTDGPRIEVDRVWHTATLLPHGDVLIAGGSDEGILERYLASEGRFEVVGELTQSRQRHTATRLLDGRVLLAGGGTALLEIYDPATNEIIPSGTLKHVRSGHVAALLPDGHVLFAGGLVDPPSPWSGANAEIWDPATHTSREPWISLAPEVPVGPGGQAVTLPSGDVFGCTNSGVSCQLCGGCWLYRPTLDVFREVPVPSIRNGGTMTRALDGSVLMAGFFLGVEEYSQGTYTLLRPRAPVATTARLDAYPGEVAVGTSAPILGAHVVGLTEATNGTTAAAAADHPIAIWMPAGEGIASWGWLEGEREDSAIWHVPPTAFPGLGSLFVSTAGAVGPGTPVRVHGSPLGAPCEAALTCASSHCSDGVCCDRACGGCEACSVAQKGAGADGFCGPLPAGASPTAAEACAAQPLSECGETGLCDGSGACALVPDGTPCLAGAACLAGECAILPSRCDGESALVSDEGVILDCEPYRCSDEGPACLSACSSSLECADGYVCSVDGECVETPPRSEGSDGCAARPGRGGHGALVAGALMLASAVLRRRRRAGLLAAVILPALLACDDPADPPQPGGGGGGHPAGGAPAGGGGEGLGGAATTSGVCGDGQRDAGEDCDGADLGGATCQSLGLDSGEPQCRHDCTLDATTCVGCGNGYLDPGEECDGQELAGESCLSQAPPAWWLFISQWFEEYADHETRISGWLGCDASCRLDTSSCGYCFDGVLNGDELCDDPDFVNGPEPPILNGATCASVDPHYVGGELYCGFCFGSEAYWLGECERPLPVPCAPGANCSLVLGQSGALALVDAGDALSLAAGPLTVEAWLRADIINPCPIGVSLGDPSDPTTGEWGLVAAFDEVQVKSLSAGAAWSTLSSYNEVVEGQWLHLAAVFDTEASETRLFVGGELRATGSLDLPLAGLPSGLLLRLVQSCSAWQPDPAGFGRLDEVRISRGARYDADFVPAAAAVPDAETLALYHFDELGDTALDSSGNGRDAYVGEHGRAGEHP